MSLLRGYLANFIKAEVISCAEDLTKIQFHDRNHQVSNEELFIGTATHLLLAEIEDEVVGTIIERKSLPVYEHFMR